MSSMECPVCSRKFAEEEIETHVIECLDEQQLQEDAKLAQQLQRQTWPADEALGEGIRTSSTSSSFSSFSVGAATAAAAAAAAAHSDWDYERPRRPVTRAKPVAHSSGDATSFGTLRTDPTNTLLAQSALQADLFGLLEERHQLKELELVYQNSEDGNSLAMLYSCVGSYAPLIILLEDSNRHLFGCFLATPLKCQKTLSTFGGTGEAFLFTLRPECEAYRWAGINDLNVACSPKSICIGCGGSGFGLQIGLEGDVTHGTSSECHTFCNPVLASSQSFTCRAVEVWRLV